MTIENIENHMAYTCKCGGVNFALLKSGAIECNKCSTPLDDVKWWAGGMGAQLARAIKAEAERDALKAAMPVGKLPLLTYRTIYEKTGLDYAAGGKQIAIYVHKLATDYARQAVAAARTQPVRETLIDGQELWLWQNGDHMLAFTHLYPCFSPGGDPMTLGEPVGRAVFKVSHDRASGITKKGEQ